MSFASDAHPAPLAQSVERETLNLKATGSSPVRGYLITLPTELIIFNIPKTLDEGVVCVFFFINFKWANLELRH